MKSNYMNYFKDCKLYQWDKNRDILTITNTTIQEEFCLDQKAMDMFLKFNAPEIKVGKTLQVQSQNLKANIKLCNEPLIMPNMEFTSSFNVELNKLKTANKFVSTSSKKPILTGVNIGNGFIAATDSFSAYRTTCNSECNITLPSKYIDALVGGYKEVEIKCNSNTVLCEIGDTTYIGKLLEGTYPNVAGLFRDRVNQVTVNKEDLKSLLAFSNSKEDYVILGPNSLTIEGENNFEAELDLNINCQICMPYERLAKAINCINEEEMIIKYDDGAKPIYINDDYLLLPVLMK